MKIKDSGVMEGPPTAPNHYGAGAAQGPPASKLAKGPFTKGPRKLRYTTAWNICLNDKGGGGPERKFPKDPQ